MKSGIYCFKNTFNGKMYVGSAVNLVKRRKYHLWQLRKGIHHSTKFQRAWDKYGEENFIYSILEEVVDVNQLITNEQKHIDLNNAVGNGYNVAGIAGSTIGVQCSQETRKKISEANKNRYKSQPHPSLGLKRADLTLRNQSNKGRKLSEDICRKRKEVAKKSPVQQISLDGNVVETYKSINEASRINNFDSGSITKCCKGQRQTAHGFKWVYALNSELQ